MLKLDESKISNFRVCPRIGRNRDVKEEDYDASLSAAKVAVQLISSALNLDTEYSAQYLVDNACPKKEDGRGEANDHKCCSFPLTVKDALKFALKEGIPRKQDWLHLGCRFKRPSLPCYAPPLVSLKGKVFEPKNMEDLYNYLACHQIGARLHMFSPLPNQPLGARLHVFTPELDRLGDGIYNGGRSAEASYVGLRDVIILQIRRDEKTTVATVKICYKKKESVIKVSMNAMFLQLPGDGRDESKLIKPTGLLVDYCIPRLSIK